MTWSRHNSSSVAVDKLSSNTGYAEDNLLHVLYNTYVTLCK